MADKVNSKGVPLVSVVRVLEYHGTEEWIRRTMEASRIPIQGLKDIGDGCSIRSGVIQWEEDNETRPAERQPIVIPPGSRTN
jgi:hypothetical protein